jgi:signal transduction histidine kinase/CheY-like chemotaxis protein
LEGAVVKKEVAAPGPKLAKAIPLSTVNASQSLKPYARSLSHELRTPMQGVVGMLDIMYSTILDAISNEQSERIRCIFNDLRTSIEVVQDSSKRAVEAADNVVHAFDMDMQMPETPMTPAEPSSGFPSQHNPNRSLEMPSAMGKKRAPSEDIAYHSGPPLKKMFSMTEAEILNSYCDRVPTAASAAGLLTPSTESSDIVPNDRLRSAGSNSPTLGPTQHRIITRDFLRNLLVDALRSGHPTEENHTNTALGERIEVQTTGSRGEVQNVTVDFEVADDVPESIITEENHLQFCVQKVVDNAIKFTDNGSITVTVRLGRAPQTIELSVADTGCGIAEEFKGDLFKPHFQQDSSIRRPKDGLGLSLFNAKAHARKNLGGDVTLARSETEGPSRGSEFLIRLPISAPDADTEVPIVGTPPPSSHQVGRSPWPEINLSPTLSAKSARARTASPPIPLGSQEYRGSSVRPVTRKRPSFNAKLAHDHPLKILIAEDNAINRNVVIGALNKLGYTMADLTVAFDGLEAVKHYADSLLGPPENRFDAILMDIWMPNMDGYQAAKRIHQLAQANGESVKIAAVTADITSASLEHAKQHGMQGFLAKPYKVLDMERLIIEHFSKPRECT